MGIHEQLWQGIFMKAICMVILGSGSMGGFPSQEVAFRVDGMAHNVLSSMAVCNRIRTCY